MHAVGTDPGAPLPRVSIQEVLTVRSSAMHRTDQLARLRELRVPTTAAALLLALATWNVTFSPPLPGLDPSWWSGLYMATERGLDFGDQVVWTYGPLGFLGLDSAALWVSDLAAWAFVYSALLYVGFCYALIWVLRRSVGLIAALVVAFLAISLLPGIEQALCLAVVACLAALVPDRPRYAVVALTVGGASFAALQMLVKLSIGPPVLVIFLLGLLGARAGSRMLALFAALFAIELAALWQLSGQQLADLPAYAATGIQIISGYSEAMGAGGAQGWLAPAGALAVVILVGAAASADLRDPRARVAAAALVGLAGFSIFKEGVVRFDSGHVTVMFGTVAALFLLLPLSAWRRPLLLGGGIVLVLLTQIAAPGGFDGGLNPIDGARRAVDQTKILASPTDRRNIAAFSRAVMREQYGLSDRVLAELEGKSVAIDPAEIAIAWTYELDWSPIPVFQGYQAYNTELDRLNADAIAAADGPERILRVSLSPEAAAADRSIDGRFPGWDPPAQALATICHFAPLSAGRRVEVLARTPDRCAEPEPAGTVEAEAGEPVAVPSPGRGEVVFARIDGVGVSGIEKLRSLLFRARLRYAVTDAGLLRLVPGTATDGLLLRAVPRLLSRGPVAQSPQTETIAIDGAGDDLRYEFFRMKVAPVPASRP